MVILSRTRGYLEPIGPATTPVNAAAFVVEAAAAHARAQEMLVLLQAELEASGKADEVRERCSVKEMYEASSKVHGDPHVMSELFKWHQSRLAPGGVVGIDEDEEDEEGGGGDLDAPLDEGAYVTEDPDTLALIEAAKTSSLKMLKPIKDQDFFLRKTKTPDYNTLSSIRNSISTSSSLPPSDSPLSQLVYTITIHPIPRYSNRSPFPTRGQTLKVLGSTTLYEMTENFQAGGDGVPEELPEEGSEDEDEWERGRESKRRWGAGKREVGSVWGCEGVLYPDGGEGKVDYAEMIVNLIESVEWTGKRSNHISQDAMDVDIEVDVDVAQEQIPKILPRDRKPKWVAGTPMQSTRIGDLRLKVAEPYWYMHQGNCEHVWTVDSIRYIHPSDPLPTDTSLCTAPYPITTFLSRLVAAKCRICDRDPGSIVTIDDELAGETPALMCGKCFEFLHGDGSQVLSIPRLM